VTLDDDVVEAARRFAGSRGLSGYVNAALQRQLQRDRIINLLNTLEDERGPIDPEVMSEVQREWPAPSVRRRRSA
jgi:hypothetical protein